MSAAFALVGCGAADDKQSNICSSYPPRIVHVVPSTASETAENAQSCVQHWSGRLAFSKDPADTVVRAAYAACDGGIADVSTFAKFEPDFDEAAWREQTARLALFRVVQQRAGDCGIPDLGEMPSISAAPEKKSQNVN